MEPGPINTLNESVVDSVTQYSELIDDAQNKKLGNRGEVVSNYYGEAVDVVATQTSHYDSPSLSSTDNARDRAYQELAKAARALESYTPKTDSYDILYGIADGLDHFSYACGSGPETSMDKKMNAYETSLTESDDVSCDDVVEQFRRIETAINQLEHGRHFESDFAAKASFSYSNVQIQRNEEVLGVKTHYSGFKADLGFHYRIPNLKVADAIQKTGPLFGLGLGSISGDNDTFDGGVFQAEVYGGWQQYFSDYVYLAPQAKVGFDHNQLNFGSGAVPDTWGTFNIGATALIGFQAPPIGERWAISVEGGYGVEQSLLGQLSDNDDYYVHGPVFKFVVTTNN